MIEKACVNNLPVLNNLLRIHQQGRGKEGKIRLSTNPQHKKKMNN
jgi:hypothetical protein